MAVVCPRVPAILSRPSSPGEATILSQKEGAVAVVCPRVPAILSRPSSPGEATILSQKDLDWLQSGVVFPPPPAPQKGRRSVSWRQVKRRERRAALKFGYSTSATLKCPTSTFRASTRECLASYHTVGSNDSTGRQSVGAQTPRLCHRRPRARRTWHTPPRVMH